MLGSFYIAQRRPDAALREFEEVARRQPKSVAAHTMVATLLDAQQKTEEARKRYEQVLAIDADAPVAANNLAWIYADRGENLDLALQLAQTAVRQLPDNPDVTDTLGWVYYKKDLASLAVPPLESAVKKNPENATYQYHLGLAYAKIGDKQNAKKSLEQALKLKGDFVGADEARRVLAGLTS